MKIPDLHVYGRGHITSRVVLEDEDGEQCDLTRWKVTEIGRTVKMGEIPLCTVTFVARLIEHEDAA